MNREIKFRIWCKVTKHFCDTPFYACHGGQLLWLHTSNQISISNLCDGDYVIQQYTGLKDKNGKEIYEGDIVKYELERDEWIHREIVYHSNGYFGTFRGLMIKPALLSPENYQYEVVGNIFENRELL